MTLTIVVQAAFVVLAVYLNNINAKNLIIETTTTKNMTTNQSDISTNNNNTIKNNDNSILMNMSQQPLSTLSCEKRDKPYFLPDKSDITKFYVCVKGQSFLLNCPNGFRFDSRLDQCIRINMLDEVQRPKKPTLIPHETNCGWYYVVRVETTGERVLNSCPMPQLFDIRTLECKNYTEVKCKERFEPKDACDYQIRSSAHSFPCSYLPSCKDRPDGLYPDRLRDCRMYFRCTSERSSESYSCTQDAFPMGERFSYEEQRCLPAQYVDCVNNEQKPLV